jgi:hypothetical protein
MNRVSCVRRTYLTPRVAQLALIDFDRGIDPQPFAFKLSHAVQIARGQRTKASTDACAPDAGMRISRRWARRVFRERVLGRSRRSSAAKHCRTPICRRQGSSGRG